MVIFNYIRQVFSRRTQVRAVLVSKVDSKFEDKLPQGMMMGDPSRIHGHEEAVNEAHWLRKSHPVSIFIFDVNGTNVELAVEKDIFGRYEENDVGILDYKGKTFYDFKKTASGTMKDNLLESMGNSEYTNWIAKRHSNALIVHYIKHVVIAAILLAFCVSRVWAINESYALHQTANESFPQEWAVPVNYNVNHIIDATNFPLFKDVWVHIPGKTTISAQVYSIYNVVEDGKALVYYDAKTGAIIPVVRSWFWGVAFGFYGIVITLLAIRIIYIFVRVIRIIRARNALLS